MIVLVGKSASGKTETAKYLKHFNFNKIITYTTRKMRVGEKDSVDYHFLKKEEFLEKLRDDFFFEHTIYNNNYYGTSKECMKKNTVVILDPQGLIKLQNSNIEHISFYLDASKETRINHMINRKDSKAKIISRIQDDEVVFDTNTFKTDYTIDVNNMTIENIARKIVSISQNI